MREVQVLGFDCVTDFDHPNEGDPLGALARARAMLIVAHPGHELRLLGWMQAARPLVQVLTDGTGAGDACRLAATAQVLTECGASAGRVFGAIADHALYSDVLQHQPSRLAAALDAMVEEAIDHDIELVVADPAEGYNPAHDLCRVLADLVAILVEQQTGRRLFSLAYDLTEWESADGCEERILWPVSETTHCRKVELAAGFPGVREDAAAAIAALGEAHFRNERFWRVPMGGARLPDRPAYEAFGERRVAAGRYGQVLRYADHVRPMVEALRLRSGVGALESASAW
jgi:hypothetical protein